MKFIIAFIVGIFATSAANASYSFYMFATEDNMTLNCAIATKEGAYLDCDCSGGGPTYEKYYSGYRYYDYMTHSTDYGGSIDFTLSNGAKCSIGYWQCPSGTTGRDGNHHMGNDGCCYSDSTCPTTSSSSYDTSHEKVVTSVRNSSTCSCTSTTTYRCKAGYYGASGTASPGTCTPCTSLSSPTGIPTATATNSGAGQTSATSCYIPAGSSSDGTGSFSWTPACPYVS